MLGYEETFPAVVIVGGRDARGTSRVDTVDAAQQHPPMHRSVSHLKGLSGPVMSLASEAENPRPWHAALHQDAGRGPALAHAEQRRAPGPGLWAWVPRPVFILLILESSKVPEAQVAESNEKDADQTSGTRLGVSWLTKPPLRGGSERGCDQVETVAALA